MIQEGLLWFDDDPVRATSDKIARAVQRYQQKYGHRPDVCYVHPAHLKESDVQPAGEVKVLPAKSVLPHHFWLGIQPEAAGNQTRSSRSAAGQSRSPRRRGW